MIYCHLSHAQLVNNGLPIVITQDGILSGQNFDMGGELINDGLMEVRQDLSILSYSGTGMINLAGMDQSVEISEETEVNNLTISGGGIKSLLSRIYLNNLIFQDGKLYVANDNLLINDGGSISGASESDYIIGKLSRTGTGDLFYPIGDSIVYVPVSLKGVAGIDPVIGVELNENGAQGIIGKGIIDLSDERYWVISEEGGTFESAFLELPTISESGIENLSDGVIAGTSLTGNVYRSYGNGSSSGDPTNGSITSSELIGPGKFAIGKYFDEQLRINDSTALVSIYQQTEGTDWLNSSGWLTEELDTWYGITVEGKRVKKIELGSNELEGAIPNFLQGLESVTDIDLGNNELIEVEPFTNQIALQNLNVESNRLQFGTLENLLNGSYSTLYQDQKKVLQNVRDLKPVGIDYIVDRTVTGSLNQYTWFEGGAQISQTGPSFIIPDLDFEDEGIFHVEVTNPNVPDLTLVSEELVLRVSSLERDSVSLLALYDNMGGENWIVGSDWPNTSIIDWEGIEILENRVQQINLAANRLTGSVPEDINDIEELRVIELSDNSIESIPDMSSLPNVIRMEVAANRLDFGDLEPNAAKLTSYSPQAKFGFANTDTVGVGEDFLLSVDVSGSNNSYSWKRDTSLMDPIFHSVQAGTGKDLLIENLSYGNMGSYRLEVENSLLPKLKLTSEIQTVLAGADLNFTALYDNRFNELSTLDEGQAWLFRVIPGEPYDTVDSPVNIVNEEITYRNVILGDYLLFVRTDSLLLRSFNGETDSVKLLPTYYSNTLDWAEADIIQLRESVEDSLFMQNQPRPLTEFDGNGVVRLLVESNFSDEGSSSGRIEARRRVQKAGCSLRRRTTGGGGRPENDDFELIAYKETDEEGRVSFGFLPTGYYRLNIQYPGIPMDTSSFVEFEITDEMENSGFDLEAEVTEDGIVVKVDEVLGFSKNYFNDLNVYPVPADEKVTISYKKLTKEGVRVKLIDLQGKTVSEEYLKKGNNQKMEMDVSQIEGGVYLLYFNDVSIPGKNISYVKVIIRHQ